MLYFRSHAIEFADSGVRVNCVAPGVIFSQTARDNYATDFDVFDVAKPGIPAKRVGTPDEVILRILQHETIKYTIGWGVRDSFSGNLPK